jgi:hypothetical protein
MHAHFSQHEQLEYSFILLNLPSRVKSHTAGRGQWGIVETEANGDPVRTNESRPSLVCSLDSSCQYKRLFWPALAALVYPIKNIFFLILHCFNSFVPIAQQAGRQSCWVARHLVVCVREEVCRTSRICTCEHFSYLGHFHSLCAVKKAERGAKHYFALQLMAVRYKELHLLFYSILAHLHNSPTPHCQKTIGV